MVLLSYCAELCLRGTTLMHCDDWAWNRGARRQNRIPVLSSEEDEGDDTLFSPIPPYLVFFSAV